MSVIAPDFPTHWKTQLLCEQLESAHAGMTVVRAWCHCHARMTDTFELTAQQLAAICGWPVKDAARLEKTLKECRWLERKGKYVTFLGWREANARIFSNQRNGGLGGRPRKGDRETQGEPMANPRDTEAKPNGNPSVIDGLANGIPKETQPKPSGVEESRGEETPAFPARARARDAIRDAVAVATQRCCALFARKKYVGHQATRALEAMAEAGVLPLSEEDWQLIERFYGAKKEAGPEAKQWRHSADSLAENLAGELDKAREWARVNGTGAPDPEPAEPIGWREWLADTYPAAAVPRSFADLDAGVRREFREWQKKNGGGDA